MVAQVIVYNQENGVVAVIYSDEKWLALLGIEGIAKKDFPTGRPYRIIEEADLPADRSHRMAWTGRRAGSDRRGVGNEYSQDQSRLNAPCCL